MPINPKWFIPIVLVISVGFIGCSDRDTENSLNSKPSNIQKIKTIQKTTNNQKANSNKTINKKVVLDVPLINQMPELYNGCEVTNLAMLLNYAGIQVDKMTLADQIKKDPTKPTHDKEGNLVEWGNPNEGFVGDITGKEDGFGVYPKPMLELMEQYLPGRTVDLTNHSFEELLQSVSENKPVIVWVTADMKAPKDFKKWQKDGVDIKVTFDEHAVLLLGYDKKYCYINNPLAEKKNQKIKRKTFEKV